MYPRDFYDQLLLNKTREFHSKIELLDWQERVIGEIQGKVKEGSLNVDGSSAVRRVCTLNMHVDNTNYNLTSLANEVSLNKKIKIFVGLTNMTKDYQDFGSVIWFPLGVYVLTEGSITHNTTENSLAITAQDKMCLLNGDVSGQIQSPAELHRVQLWNEEKGKYEFQDLLIYDVIKNAVMKLGGENPAKIIINDVPLEYKVPLQYVGFKTLYFDRNNNQLEDVYTTNDPRVDRILRTNDFAGYEMRPMTYPKELIKVAGDTVASVLEEIKGVLGNFEYFYDIDGNFIFQEVKNYTNNSFLPLTELSDGHYAADFSKTPNVYSFKEKDIVQSFSNLPDWKGIRNDFVVWGMRQGGAGITGAPIMFHLTIDNKPFLPPTYDKPWQQFLVEYGDNNPSDPGPYYQELKGKLPQVYNSETNKWQSDSSNYTYYFDMIDAKSELGKFSVSTIGRRTKTIVDENVTIMYPPVIPDVVILPAGTDPSYLDHLITIGQRFQVVSASDFLNNYRQGGVGKDAFGVVRELLYSYTTFNEVVTIATMPMYFLEANNRIEVEDPKSNVFGDYIIKSMSIPLSAEGLMSINAIRVSSRI